MDIKLDLSTGDAVFENGATPIVADTGDNVAQRLYIMLRTFAGEWYLNTEHGIPYFQKILGKKTTKEAINLIFQQKILEEEGVQEIIEFSSSLDSGRTYSMRFKVRAADSVVIVPTIEVGV